MLINVKYIPSCSPVFVISGELVDVIAELEEIGW